MSRLSEYDPVSTYHDDEKLNDSPTREVDDELAQNLLVITALRNRLRVLGIIFGVSLLLNVLFAGYVFLSALFMTDDTLAARLSLGFGKSYVEWKGDKPVWCKSLSCYKRSS